MNGICKKNVCKLPIINHKIRTIVNQRSYKFVVTNTNTNIDTNIGTSTDIVTKTDMDTNSDINTNNKRSRRCYKSFFDKGISQFGDNKSSCKKCLSENVKTCIIY